MPARRKPTPSYLPHNQSGRARAVWTDISGTRHQKLLPGPFDSPESRAAFGKLQLELAASPLARSPVADPDGVTVAELLLAYLDHAERHYRRGDGTPTHEVVEYKLVCRLIRGLYAELPAAEFSPSKLKTVQRAMLDKGWCRTLVNQRVGRVRRMWKWGAGEELVPFAAYHALTAVAGLQAGRTNARETAPVGPVDDATVDATLPYLNRHVAGLVEFQRLTGCRPGEACILRRLDLDMSGPVWLFRPSHHKLAYKNKPRVIAVGPRAQQLLKGFFTPDIRDYLFSPRRAVEEYHAARSAKRATPKFPSHMTRNGAKRVKVPRRRPGSVYNADSYGTAVARACDRAKVSHWHPNQLRHSFATTVRKRFGLESAQVVLGHSKADVTQVYAERNEDLAATVAAKIG